MEARQKQSPLTPTFSPDESGGNLRRLALLAAIALLSLPLSGCFFGHGAAKRPPAPAADDPSRPQSSRYAQNDDSGPGGPLPDIGKIPEPVPKAEPRSIYGNKSPYEVRGKSYSVLPSTQGYVERGIASWYGNKFHGYATSNFEKYDMYAYTAAHKTLPLPSYARVTNLENGASVIVRINDRGPFAENRIIDLSYVAAVKLGIWRKGTGLVEVRGIDPDHPDRAAPASTAPAAAPPRVASAAPVPAPGKTGKPALYLQIGAYSDRANAERAAAALREARIGAVHVVEGSANGRPVRRVRIGPLRDAGEADALTPKVRALGLGEPHVAIEAGEGAE